MCEVSRSGGVCHQQGVQVGGGLRLAGAAQRLKAGTHRTGFRVQVVTP